MKTGKSTLSVLMLMILFLTTSLSVQAQGQGRGNGKENAAHDRNSDYDKGHSNGHRSNRHYGYDRNDHHHSKNNRSWGEHLRNSTLGNQHRYVTYRHHRHSHPSWAPAYGYRYNTRYIYYQDHDVYYDCHRDVFLVWTGRSWRVSSRIPDALLRVDFRSARVYGVNYWDDDIDFYLQRRRPSYLSISAGW
jgi:hypothetical protein